MPATQSTTAARQRRLALLPHQEIEYRAHQTHDLILSIGGVGSGKTTSFALWLLDRMRNPADLAQVHGLFALTTVQLRSVMRVIYKQFDQMRLERVFDRQPPREWWREWERKGIRVPPRQDRYENVVIWRTGLHLQLGTIGASNYEQYRGAEWGSIGVEEFTLQGVTQNAVEFLFERTRCGEGDEFCAAHHRHTKVLHGNPPENPDHWVFDWLDTLERSARDIARAAGTEIPAVDGYPHLTRGIGSAILIPSRSTDNEANLPKGYVSNQLLRLDTETAQRRIGGVLTRAKVGRAYADYSRENEIAVAYDPDRTLYVGIDFNNRPIGGVLCHPLNPGEYPSEHERAGVDHIGQFGEVFDAAGGGLEALCSLLLSGGVGSNGAAPHNWGGLLAHRGRVVFFGDSTGQNRTPAGKTLWGIVDDVVGRELGARGIKYARQVPHNPLVPLRVRAVNAKLCSAAGVRSYWIDPRCDETIADFLVCVWDKHKPDLQKYGERGGRSLWLRTHLSDALGYLIDALFPLGRPTSPTKLDLSSALSPGIEPPRMR